jgi:enoyl-CoA hydratase/carnithine racemase
VSESLVRERRGNVLVARLNRPEARNALDGDLLARLAKAVEDAEADPEIRALVLTGTGDRAFCAGMDLRSFASGEQGSLEAGALDAYFRMLHGQVSVPMVGAANATALAGGLELLLSCDVVVVSSEAKFGLPEVKRGLFPAGNGTSLGTRIPLAIALEMTLTGDSIDAARAYELGLVNRVVPPGEVLNAAVALAERIASNGPLAVAATKELVRLAPVDFARAQQRVRELQPVVFASEDAREGATAFVEKRPPVWRGK